MTNTYGIHPKQAKEMTKKNLWWFSDHSNTKPYEICKVNFECLYVKINYGLFYMIVLPQRKTHELNKSILNYAYLHFFFTIDYIVKISSISHGIPNDHGEHR